MRRVSVFCFSMLVCILFFVSFFQKTSYDIDQQPWHMKPWENVDSLSDSYKNNYVVLEDSLAIRSKFSSDSFVFILVDAWGVPLNEETFLADLNAFAEFNDKKIFIHPRSLNQNKYVEQTEFKDLFDSGIFLFGGDSLEYQRRSYIPSLGFNQISFCQECSDEIMINMLDSVLFSDSISKSIAWTTQSSRDGNRENLRKSLGLIADLAKKHPDKSFVIQGTHRPILGTPETRKEYYAHWVPVVILNNPKKPLN